MSNLKRFGPIALVALLAIGLVASGVWRDLSFDRLQAHHAALAGQAARHPITSLAIFIGIDALVVTACIPGPGLMMAAGGFLFGTVVGGLASLTGGVVGSTLVFLACRTAFGDLLARRAGDRARRLAETLSRDGLFYLLALRLIPIVPYFVSNLAAGLARVRLRVFLSATLIGAAPISFILAALGAGLGRLFDRGLTVNAAMLLQPRIILPLAAMGVLSAAPIVWRLVRRR